MISMVSRHSQWDSLVSTQSLNSQWDSCSVAISQDNETKPTSSLGKFIWYHLSPRRGINHCRTVCKYLYANMLMTIESKIDYHSETGKWGWNGWHSAKGTSEERYHWCWRQCSSGVHKVRGTLMVSWLVCEWDREKRTMTWVKLKQKRPKLASQLTVVHYQQGCMYMCYATCIGVSPVRSISSHDWQQCYI